MRATDIPDDVKEKINKYLVRNKTGVFEIEQEIAEDDEEQSFEEIDEELREIMLNTDTIESVTEDPTQN